jgi:predicted enzyme related to lactoylglutathione lyase
MEAPNMALRRNPALRQSCAVFAKNKKRVSAFYQQVLGLDVVESRPSYDLLRGNGCEIVVHGIPRKYAAAIKLAKPVEPREETPFKPTFVVGNLESVRVAAAKTGGCLQSLERAWHFLGCIVLDGWDPEGNIVQFRQPE